MDKVIQDKLMGSIDEVEKWVGASKDFVVEQAPLVAQEVIRWGMGKDIFGIACGVTMLVIGLFLVRFVRNRDWSNMEDTTWANGFTIICTALSFLGLLVGSIITMINTYDLVYVCCAPRLYILQEVSKLLHN